MNSWLLNNVERTENWYTVTLMSITLGTQLFVKNESLVLNTWGDKDEYTKKQILIKLVTQWYILKYEII